MKNLLIITFLSLSFIACKTSSDEPTELATEIKKLREENKKLKDSITKNIETELMSQIVIGIPDETVMKVGKKNNINFLFQKWIGEFPKYEIYKVENGKEIKIGYDTKTKFSYKFIPKSVNDNKLELRIKIPYKDRKIEIPARMEFEVAK